MVGPVIGPGQDIADGRGADEEEVQQEARPDEQGAPLITSDLAHAVAYDVAYRKYQQPSGDVEKPQANLLSLEDI